MKNYNKYLKTKTWKKKRIRVLKRDGFKCTSCKSKRRLHVHHKTYRRVGKERMSDLATLCSKCHKKAHSL